jgi:hypothetical protein
VCVSPLVYPRALALLLFEAFGTPDVHLDCYKQVTKLEVTESHRDSGQMKRREARVGQSVYREAGGAFVPRGRSVPGETCQKGRSVSHCGHWPIYSVNKL